MGRIICKDAVLTHTRKVAAENGHFYVHRDGLWSVTIKFARMSLSSRQIATEFSKSQLPVRADSSLSLVRISNGR
jgi:hypothetical protein